MAGLDDCDLENMEGGMNIYGQRTLKMHSSRVDVLEIGKVPTNLGANLQHAP